MLKFVYNIFLKYIFSTLYFCCALTRAWCPDRTLSQSKKYVASSLDARYTEPVILSVDVLLSESRPLTPMTCFLSLGSDPTPLIENAAKRNERECKSISMGQGQEVHARKLLSLFMSQVSQRYVVSFPQ